jgi:hypothetical protein
MVNHRRLAQQDQLSPRMTSQSYPRSIGKRLKGVPASYRSLGPVPSRNLKLRGCSSELSPMTTSMRTNSYPTMSPISRCSITSSATKPATLTELATSNSSSQDYPMADQQLPRTDQSQLTLLDRLSDHYLPSQEMEKKSIQKELAWTTTHCHGMNQKISTSAHQVYRRRYRKPTLSSRISLATQKGRGRRCSTAVGQSRNSLHPSGSIYSAETLSTSTTCSRTSTPCPTVLAKSLSSEKTSNCSMGHQHQQKLSKPTEIGLSPGIPWLKPPSSYSSIESRNCKPTVNTSNVTSRRCLPSCTPESSTMTEQPGSELPSVETLNCRASPSSLICRSNGSITRQVSPQINRENLQRNQRSLPERGKRDVEVPPVEGGMRADVPTRQQSAITYTSVPNVPTQVTSLVTATPRVRSRRPDPSLRWECRPRFVREYVWADYETQDLTTALTSETAPPLPEPPENELSSTEKWEVIRARPHLFRITTPIHVDRFYELLSTHPNRPPVESMNKGLRVGFWPWAITLGSDAPSIVDNAQLQKVKDPTHLRFMNEQRDEEIRLGRFSCAFNVLSPGMTTIPLWVVPKPHSDKLRLVVDHSAGDYSPNSYIPPEEASVHLDTLHVLGKALLDVRTRYGDVPIVLFKTDVSQAYRRLPVHPLWQLRQVVSIQGSFHVDNNNNFGDRGAGRLWVTFFSLVLWIAIFVKHIHDLFAYVDDAYSWEFADRVTFYSPYQKFLPTKQAQLLSLFDDLGVPHEERKQVFGSPLQIIGFEVDPSSMTITMPLAARDELVSAVRAFANPRQRRSLRDFQRLAGWVNWSLNVYPLLRPGLSGVYEKMRRGSYKFPFQKLSINNAVSNELRWLASHIERSDGVRIIDSREWSRSEAHDSFLCDACPTGMGYWSPKTCEGFVCATPSETRNGIFFFEALTVLSALSHACETILYRPCQLAILTDSLNTFDMFNTLHALPAYNPILITATDLLVTSGIKLRVFHLPREENKVADALSRLDVPAARRFQPGLAVTKFSPPRFTLGEAQL